MQHEFSDSWCSTCHGEPSPKCRHGHEIVEPTSLVDHLVSKAKNGNLGMFVGAGISHWKPANNPLGDELKRYVIDGLLKRAGKHYPTDQNSLTLERLISLTGWGVEFCMDDIFSRNDSVPNAWHMLTASLIKKKMLSCVFTTNFDKLLDMALQEIGCDFTAVELETYQLPRHEDPGNPAKPTLYYLHGTHEAWNMCITVPHILDFSLASNRLRPLTKFLENRERTLLVIGYSATDLDVALALRRSETSCKAEIILVSKYESGPCFKRLDGCFEQSVGVKSCVSDHKVFLKEMWNAFGVDHWGAFGEARCQSHVNNHWIELVDSWLDEIPRSAIESILQRISSLRDYAASQTKTATRIIVKTKTDVIEFVGNLVLINVPHTQRLSRLYDRDSSHGALLWHVFNRRLRALGYMTNSRTIDLSTREGLTGDLCSTSEEELLFYVHKLIEAESTESKEFTHKALVALSNHSLLHALTH